jgi:modulator of FtsH protease
VVTTFDSLPNILQGWQNFYILAGTASATLTGLMFVAITFGSGLVTRETAQSTRAFLDPIYLHFVQVMFTSCLLTIPVLAPTWLGGVLIVAGALRLMDLHTVLRRYQEAHRKHNDIELSDWLAAIVLPLLCYMLLIATGAGFILHQEAALIGLAIVNLALLFIGIYSAWELFVWMALAVGERRRDPSAQAQPPRDRAE